MRYLRRPMHLLPGLMLTFAASMVPMFAAYACIIDQLGSTYVITCQGGNYCTLRFPSGNSRPMLRSEADRICQ